MWDDAADVGVPAEAVHRRQTEAAAPNQPLVPPKIGAFKVLSKVSKLAYKLDLPPHIKIHPVVSVIHLEPAPRPLLIQANHLNT